MRTTVLAALCLGLTGCVGTAGSVPSMFTGGATGTVLGPNAYPAAPYGTDPRAPAAAPAEQPVSAAEIAREEKYCAPIDITFHAPGCQHADMMKVWSQNMEAQQAGAAAGIAAQSTIAPHTPVRGVDY